MQSDNMNRIGASLTAVGVLSTIILAVAAIFTKDFGILMSLIVTVLIAIAGIISLIRGDDDWYDKTVVLALCIIPGVGSFLMKKNARALIQFTALVAGLLMFVSVFFIDQQYVGVMGAYSMLFIVTLAGWCMLDTNQICSVECPDEESIYDLDIKNYPRAKNIWLLICIIAVACVVIPFSSSNGVPNFGITLAAIHCVISILCLVIDGAILRRNKRIEVHI